MTGEFDDLTEDDIELVMPEKEESSAPAAAPAEMEKLSQALDRKTKEAAEAHDRYLRTSADFENYRKRMQRDLAEFKKYANEQMARELLSVVDHLALAIKHASETDENSQGLREGVELVSRQLHDVLEKFGITQFPAQGEPFDPKMHDAAAQEVTDAVPENTVVHVFQEGYLYHDKVLRHAKVSVSKKPAAEVNTEQGE
jgi:molecular chaperone GrpE